MPTIKTNRIDLAYEDEGTGPPLVLLHGYPFNRTLWRDQIDYFRNEFRIIAPDLRGLGDSSCGSGPATMEDMAHDVAMLLDQLGLERVIIGGLSMGGYVALAFFRNFPEQVAGLILADTRPQADTDEARINREKQADKILKEGMDPIVNGFLDKALAAETLQSKPAVVERMKKMIAATKPEGAANALRGMAMRHDQTLLLTKVAVPSLIIVGSEDQITPSDDARLMQSMIHGSTLEIIERAGHVSNVERPEEFNGALKRFLDTMYPS